MESIILEAVGWFGVASMLVFSLFLLGLFVFIWQVIQSFFPEPYTPLRTAVPEFWQPAPPPAPQEDPMPLKMSRSVGYCKDTECEDYAKGTFLINHGDTFWCPRCKKIGFIEAEAGTSTGDWGIYKEVRIEYNYDPTERRYRELAIVRDESLWGRNNVYTLKSPLIRTEKRALKVAESMLANLNMQEHPLGLGEIPRTQELILSFDVSPEKFSEEIARLRGQLESSTWSKARESHQDKKYAITEADIGI